MMVNALMALGQAYVNSGKGKMSGRQREQMLGIAVKTEKAKSRALERGQPKFQTTQFKPPPSKNIPMERFLGLWERSLQYATNLTEATLHQMKQENKSESQIKSMQNYLDQLNESDVTTKSPTIEI